MDTIGDSKLLGKYVHSKSRKLYEIIGFARHSETLVEMVVYKALYDSPEFGVDAIWVRPRDMFFEKVLINGKLEPRFRKVE